MPVRIIVNDKECTNRVVKWSVGLSTLVGAIAISALIVFVLLPVIGVTIAATMGLLIVISVGIFAAALALTLGTAVLGTILAFIDYLASKFRK